LSIVSDSDQPTDLGGPQYFSLFKRFNSLFCPISVFPRPGTGQHIKASCFRKCLAAFSRIFSILSHPLYPLIPTPSTYFSYGRSRNCSRMLAIPTNRFYWLSNGWRAGWHQSLFLDCKGHACHRNCQRRQPPCQCRPHIYIRDKVLLNLTQGYHGNHRSRQSNQQEYGSPVSIL
jgi:hypothetical protein